MQTLSREQEELLQRLVELAGSPVILEQALRDTGDVRSEADLERLVRRILETRHHDLPSTLSA